MKMALLLASIPALAACATPSSVSTRLAETRGPAPRTALVLETSIESENPVVRENGCRFTFRHRESGKDFDVAQPAGSSAQFAELPAGTHDLHKVYCYRLAQFDNRGTAVLTVRVIEGKLSYLGPLQVLVPLAGSGQRLTIQAAPESGRLTRLVQSLPREDSSRLVAAFDGQPIPRRYFGDGASM